LYLQIDLCNFRPDRIPKVIACHLMAHPGHLRFLDGGSTFASHNRDIQPDHDAEGILARIGDQAGLLRDGNIGGLKVEIWTERQSGERGHEFTLPDSGIDFLQFLPRQQSLFYNK
jgi:hypothetical protein